MLGRKVWQVVPSPVRGVLRPVLLRLGIKELLKTPYERNGFPLSGTLDGLRIVAQVGVEYMNGQYEPKVTQALESIISAGWTCIDVGANEGYFTLLMAKLVGESGRVFAFEAHPDNATLIRRNAAINSFQNRVQVENLAIADDTHDRVTLSVGRFSYSMKEWNIFGRNPVGEKAPPTLEVAATSLDRYFPVGTQIDLIKMDIEGAESLALPGMVRIIRESQPIMIIEFHDDQTWPACVDLICDQYDLLDLNTRKRTNNARNEARIYHCLAVPKDRNMVLFGQLGSA